MTYIKKRSVSLLVKTLVIALLLPTLSLDAQSKKATVTQKVSVKTPSAASKTLLVLARTEINQLRYSYAIPFLKRYLKQSPPDSISLPMRVLIQPSIVFTPISKLVRIWFSQRQLKVWQIIPRFHLLFPNRSWQISLNLERLPCLLVMS